MSIKRMSRGLVRNREEIYKETMKQRGVKYIDHYPTAQMHHPTAEEIADIDSVSHIWKAGDRYSKLAHKYYGDPELWWVIAWFNQKPTDSHNALGDVLYIPMPLEKIMLLLRLRG